LVHPKKKGCSATCRFCNHLKTINITRQREHLTECVKYKAHLAEQERGKRKRDGEQLTIGGHLTTTEHKHINNLAAMMLYETGLPFMFFEKPSVKAFLTTLRPAYTPPSSFYFANQLLHDTWIKVKQEVDAHIDREEEINVTFDGATNILY
jgi:hypothetical protein